MPNNDYANEPNQSRSEDIIQSILDNTEYNEDAGSRIEYLLIELKNAIEGGGGGGGGVTSYSPLTEKPKIDNHTLQAGNNTSSDLGLQTKLTFDSAPTESSTNPVTSGGVYTALAAKANAADVYNKSSVDTALSNKADKSTTYTKSEVDTALSSKQNTISDLSTIRSGAAAGATAVQPISGKGLSTNDYTNGEKTKLAGIAEGAEVNVQSDWEQTDNTADDYIKGKPTIPTVNDSTITIQKNGTTVKSFTTNQASGDTIDITVPTSAADVSAIPTSAKGTASGVAELDSNGKVPSSQLPSYVDDVIEGYYYNGKFYEESAHTTEITGETGKIYIDLSGTNKTYRWSGSGYTEISESLALGETSSTAYRGDRGKTAYDHATESRLTTATESGLYKVASTAEGHIASLTSVQKSDITALGIPTQDTTYTFEGTYNASTNKAATMADIKDGKLTGYTQGSGNVAATDKVVEAIGKVEKKADDNKNNISSIKEKTDNIMIDSNRNIYIQATAPTGTIPVGSTWISGGSLKGYVQESNVSTATIEQGTFNADGSESPNNNRVRTTFDTDIHSMGAYTVSITGANDVLVFVYDSDKTCIQSEGSNGWKSLPYSFNLAGDRYVRFAFRKTYDAAISPSDVSNYALAFQGWK